MRSSLPQTGKGGTRGAACGVAGVMLVVASVAAAQEQPDPFRFLRPWLEPQDRGSEAPAAPPQSPAAPSAGTGTSGPANIPAPDGGEAAAGQAPTDAPQSAAAPPQAPAAPAPGSGTSEPANVPAPDRGEATAGPAPTDPPQSAAAAPAQPNPFLFLRPWLERQFRRSETQPSPPLASPGTEAAEPANVAAPEGGAAAAGLPQTDAPGSAAAVQPRPAAPDASEPSGAPAAAPASPGRGSRVIGTLPPLQRDRPGTGDLAAPQAGEPKLERREAPQPLRLAVLAGDDPTATIRSLAMMTDALARAIGRPVEILPVASYEGMIDAQVERRIDGGFYSAAAFAAAEGECRCLEPLVAPASGDGTTAYHAVIVTRRDSGIGSAADLAGRSIATGAADSIGARRMQLAGLLAEGIDPKDFGEVFTVGSAEDAVRLAAQDAVDAAFAWSSLSGDVSRGYSRGTLADLVARGEIGTDELAVIWRSPPITHGPVAVLRSLPETEKQTLESYLLRLERWAPEIYDRLNPLYSGGYIAVDASDYAGLAVLASQKLDAVKLPEAGVEGPPFPPEEGTSP